MVMVMVMVVVGAVIGTGGTATMNPHDTIELMYGLLITISKGSLLQPGFFIASPAVDSFKVGRQLHMWKI